MRMMDTSTLALLDELQQECEYAAVVQVDEDDDEDVATNDEDDEQDNAWLLRRCAEQASNERRFKRRRRPNDNPTSLAMALRRGRFPSPAQLSELLLNYRSPIAGERADIAESLRSWRPRSCSVYAAELLARAEHERDAPLTRSLPRLRYCGAEYYQFTDPRYGIVEFPGTIVSTQLACQVMVEREVCCCYYYEVTIRCHPLLFRVLVGWAALDDESVFKRGDEHQPADGLFSVPVASGSVVVAGVLVATNGTAALSIDGELVAVKQVSRRTTGKPRYLYPSLRVVEAKETSCIPSLYSAAEKREEKKEPLRSDGGDDAKAVESDEEEDDGESSALCTVNFGSSYSHQTQQQQQRKRRHKYTAFVHDPNELAAKLSLSPADCLDVSCAEMPSQLSIKGGTDDTCPVFALGAKAFERDNRGATLELILKVKTRADSILAWRCDSRAGFAFCLFTTDKNGEEDDDKDSAYLALVLFDVRLGKPVNIACWIAIDAEKRKSRRVSLNSWHHVAFAARRSRRGDAVSLFVDGRHHETMKVEAAAVGSALLLHEEAATRVASLCQRKFGTESAFVLGAPAARIAFSPALGEGEPLLEGELGEARLWTERLSRRAVESAFCRGEFHGDESRLAACWPFDEASGVAARSTAVDVPKSWLESPLRIDDGCSTWTRRLDEDHSAISSYLAVTETVESATQHPEDDVKTLYFDDDDDGGNGTRIDIISLPRSCLVLDAEAVLFSSDDRQTGDTDERTVILDAIYARIFRLASAALASHATDARRLRAAVDDALFFVVGNGDFPFKNTLIAVINLLAAAETPIMTLAATRWLRACLMALSETCALNLVSASSVIDEAMRGRILSVSLSTLSRARAHPGDGTLRKGNAKVSSVDVVSLEICALLTEGRNLELFMLKDRVHCPNTFVDSLISSHIPECLRQAMFDSISRRRRLLHALVPVIIRPRLLVDIASDVVAIHQAMKDDACAVPRIGDVCRHARTNALGIIIRVMEEACDVGDEEPVAQVSVLWFSRQRSQSQSPTCSALSHTCRVRLKAKESDRYSLRKRSRKSRLVFSKREDDDDIAIIMRESRPLGELRSRNRLLSHAREMFSPEEFSDLRDCDDATLRMEIKNSLNDRFINEIELCDCSLRFSSAVSGLSSLQRLIEFLVAQITFNRSARKIFHALVGAISGTSLCNRLARSRVCLAGEAPPVLVRAATSVANLLVEKTTECTHHVCTHLLRATRATFEGLTRFDGYSGDQELLKAVLGVAKVFDKIRARCDPSIVIKSFDILVCRVISNCCGRLLIPHSEHQDELRWWKYWLEQVPQLCLADVLTPADEEDPKRIWIQKLLTNDQFYADIHEKMTRLSRLPAAFLRIGGPELDEACRYAVVAALYHSTIFLCPDPAIVNDEYRDSLVAIWRQIPRLRTWVKAQPDPALAAERCKRNAIFLLSFSTRQGTPDEGVKHDTVALFRLCREAKPEELCAVVRTLTACNDHANTRAMVLKSWRHAYTLASNHWSTNNVAKRRIVLTQCFSPPVLNKLGLLYLPSVLAAVETGELRVEKLAEYKAHGSLDVGVWLKKSSRRQSIMCREIHKFTRLDGASCALVENADLALDEVYAEVSDLVTQGDKQTLLNLAVAWTSRIVYFAGHRDELTVSFFSQFMAASVRVEGLSPMLSSMKSVGIRLGLIACQSAIRSDRNALNSNLLSLIRPCLLSRSSREGTLRLLLLARPSNYAADSKWLDVFKASSSESWRKWRMLRICSGVLPADALCIDTILVKSALDSVAARFRCDEAIFPQDQECSLRGDVLAAAAEACAFLRHLLGRNDVCTTLVGALVAGRRTFSSNAKDALDVTGVSSENVTSAARCLAVLQVLGGFRERPTVGADVVRFSSIATKTSVEGDKGVLAVLDIKEDSHGVEVCNVIDSTGLLQATGNALTIPACELGVVRPIRLDWTNSAGVNALASEIGETFLEIFSSSLNCLSTWRSLVRGGTACCARLICTGGENLYPAADDAVVRLGMQALCSRLRCIGASILSKAIELQNVAGVAACDKVEMSVDMALDKARSLERRARNHELSAKDTGSLNERGLASRSHLSPLPSRRETAPQMIALDSQNRSAQPFLLARHANRRTIFTQGTSCEHDSTSMAENKVADGSEDAMSSSAGSVSSTLVSLLVEMGFSEDLCARTLEHTNNDFEAALHLMLEGASILMNDAEEEKKSPIDGIVDDEDDQSRHNRSDGNVPQLVGAFGLRHPRVRDDEREDQNATPSMTVETVDSAIQERPILEHFADGDKLQCLTHEAPAKADAEHFRHSTWPDDDKTEECVLTSKAVANTVEDSNHFGDTEGLEIHKEISREADAKDACNDAQHDTRSHAPPSVPALVTSDEQDRCRRLVYQESSHGLEATIVQLRHRTHAGDDHDESRWPRMYHVSTRSTIALRAFPRASAAPVTDVRSGDELVALGESGDWLQVWVSRQNVNFPQPTASRGGHLSSSLVVLPQGMLSQQRAPSGRTETAHGVPSTQTSSHIAEEGSHPLPVSNGGSSSVAGFLSTENLRELAHIADAQRAVDTRMIERAGSECSTGMSTSQFSEIIGQGDINRCAQSQQQQYAQLGQRRALTSNMPSQSAAGDLQEISEGSAATSVFEDGGNIISTSANISNSHVSRLRSLVLQQHPRGSPLSSLRHAFNSGGVDEEYDINADTENESSVGEGAIAAASVSALAQGDESVADSSLFYYALSNEGTAAAGSVMSETDRGTVFMFGENMSERELNVWGVESVRDDASLVSISRGDDGPYLHADTFVGIDDNVADSQGQQRRMSATSPGIVDSVSGRSRILQGSTGWIEKFRVDPGPCSLNKSLTDDDQASVASSTSPRGRLPLSITDNQQSVNEKLSGGLRSATLDNAGDDIHLRNKVTHETREAFKETRYRNPRKEKIEYSINSEVVGEENVNVAVTPSSSGAVGNRVANKNSLEIAHAHGICAFPLLESEAGDEFFHREDRYFGTRQGDAPNCCDDFRRPSLSEERPRRQQIEAACTGTLENHRDYTTHTPQEVSKQIASLIETMVSLQSRLLSLGLILHWSTLKPDSSGDKSPRNTAFEFFSSNLQESPSLAYRTMSKNIVGLYQLLMFRDWTPDWWPASLVQDVVGGPLTFPLEGATLPALMSPLLVRLMSFDDSLDGSVGERVAQSLREELVAEVCDQLAAASMGDRDRNALIQGNGSQRQGRKINAAHEESMASIKHPLELTDFEVQGRCCLAWAQWISRLIFMRVPPLARAVDPAHSSLFRAWLGCLSTSDLRLKQHAASELAAILSTLVKLKAHHTLAACTNQLPLTRVRHLASWRLVRESDDYPVVSRYLQAIIDLIATAVVAEDCLKSAPSVIDKAVIQDLKVDVDGPMTSGISIPDAHMCPRYALSLPGEGSMVVGARDVSPPWTAEFYLFRHEDDAEPLCLSSTCGTHDVEWLPAICLAATPFTGHTIRLQKGGALFHGRGDAKKFCVGGSAFDFEVPCGRWVHIALIARERSPNSTVMLCGSRAFWEDEVIAGGQSIAEVSRLKHVVELFADGESKGTVSIRAPLPCGLVGLDCPQNSRAVVDTTGVLRVVSDENNVCEILRRRRRDYGCQMASGGKSLQSSSAGPGDPSPSLADIAFHDDGDDVHLIVDQAGACAARSPRCYFGLVRYWSVARAAADIRRYIGKRPPEIATTGLLGSWELAFEDVSPSSSKSVPPRFVFDSTEQHTGCALRGDATWSKLPPTAESLTLLENYVSVCSPNHDTCRDVVLHGTVLRRAVLGMTHGPLCRNCEEALILRLSINERNEISGVAEWHDRGNAYLVSGSVKRHSFQPLDSKSIDNASWGHESSFELIVGELVHGSDGVALSHECTPRELVRYDDERGLDACCILSPRGSKIVGRAEDSLSSISDECNSNGHGSWTGEIELEESLVRSAVYELRENLPRNFEASNVTCRIDEMSLPDSLWLRPVYGDYAQDGDDTASVRRLLVSSPFGGRFVAQATVLHGENDGDDEAFPALRYPLEIAKNRAGNIGEIAGELTIQSSILARNAADELMACACSLDGAIDDDASRRARMSAQERVRIALEVAARAADARRKAFEANAMPLTLDTASERIRRRCVGPTPVSRQVSDQNDLSSNQISNLPAGSQSADANGPPLSRQPSKRADCRGACLDDVSCDLDQHVAENGIPNYDRKDDDLDVRALSTRSVPAQSQVRNESGLRVECEGAVMSWWGIGSRCGKWTWEWDVRRIGSGDLALGVRGMSASSTHALGSDHAGWAYKSTGEVSHGGHRFKTTSFGPGDIIGVEVELFCETRGEDIGRVRFFKNGAEIAPLASEDESGDPSTKDFDRPHAPSSTTLMENDRDSAPPKKSVCNADALLGINSDLRNILFGGTPLKRRGLRASAQLGGAGDAVVFLGFKRGFGVRHYATQVSGRYLDDSTVAVASYKGDLGYTGVRHGRGELSFSNCDGRWIGAWYKDKQHGVHLWVEDGKVTPVLFERGERNRAIISDDDALEEIEAYRNGLVDPSTSTHQIATGDALQNPIDEERHGEGENESSPDAHWRLRVVYQQGATVRRGIEIDSSDIVRRVAVGEELDATERAVTADGVPRYKVRLLNKQREAYEYGWISEHLRGGAKDQVCIILRHLLSSTGGYLRYRVVRPGGAMIRATSSLDGKEIGLAPHATALWVAERLRLAHGTLRLRIVAPERWIGWASEKEHIVTREPSCQELAREARSREQAQVRLESMKSQVLKSRAQRRRIYYAHGDINGDSFKSSTAALNARVTACFKASRRSPFLLDRLQCASNISISPDLLTASGTAPRRGCGVVLGTKRMRRGLHYWEVRVEQATWGSIFIGVAARGDVVGFGASLSDVGSSKRSLASHSRSGLSSRRTIHTISRQRAYAISDRRRFTGSIAPRQSESLAPSAGWGGLGFLNYRATQAYGAEAAYGTYIGAGDVVGVLLDADKGTISFVKEGDDFIAGRPIVANLGVAFSSIWRRAASRSPSSRAGLYACLGIKGEGNRLSLLTSKSWSSEEDPGGACLPRRLARLENVVNALVMLDGWRMHARLLGTIERSDESRKLGWRLVLKSADRIHRRWRTSPMRAVVTSRAKCNVELDTSSASIIAAAIASGIPNAWATASLQLGAACRVPQGEVQIVGAARGHIWFAGPSIDEGRAWFWNTNELRTLAQTGSFISAPSLEIAGDRISVHEESPKHVESVQRPSTSSPLPTGDTHAVAVGSATPGDNFDSKGFHCESFLLKPIDFSSSVEEETDEAGIDTALASFLDTLASRVGISPALVPASKLASALCFQSSRLGDGKMYATRPESLRGVSAEMIVKRFAMLTALNDAVTVALPYVDFGRGDLALAELGDLTGGVLNPGTQTKKRDPNKSIEKAYENERLLNNVAPSTSYYGALAAVGMSRQRHREQLRVEPANYGSFDIASPLCEMDPRGVKERYRDVRAGIDDESSRDAAMLSLTKNYCLSWGPESWWGGAIPPRSDHDVHCCSQIPALDSLLHPAARSWTGGRAIVAIRDRIFYRHVKRNFFAQILSATTTFTAPPPDAYDHPDELREFRVNRLVSTRNLHTKRKEGDGVEKRFKIPLKAEEVDDAFEFTDDSTAMETPLLSRNHIERQTVFGQMHAQMRSRCDARSMRRSFVHVQDSGQPRAFYVKFVGEGVDDHGGPYRAIFQSALADEPRLSILGLLRGAPAAGGLVPRADREFRDFDDELYRTFGTLIALAGRHKVSIDVNLSHRAFWRPLAAQSSEIPFSSESSLDTDECSLLAVHTALFLAEDEDSYHSARDLFLDVCGRIERRNAASMRRSLQLGNGACLTSAFYSQPSVVYGVACQLAAREKDAAIPSDNLSEICKQLIVLHGTRARALASIVRGAATTMPVELFPLFDAIQLEELICGPSDIRLDELKQNTTYEGIDQNDQHVQYFWQALETFDTLEMAKFVEFCSGSSRLPRGDGAQGAQRFKLTAPRPGNADKSPDDYLPVSQTCFFSLALPRYSSAEVCASKLRYAIANARLMDADFLMRHTEGWDTLDDDGDDDVFAASRV